jgi:hypothetical protein
LSFILFSYMHMMCFDHIHPMCLFLVNYDAFTNSELEVNLTDISGLMRRQNCCLNIMFRNRKCWIHSALHHWLLWPSINHTLLVGASSSLNK